MIVDPFHGTPLALVERAVARQHEDRARPRREPAGYDEIWCAFDRDDHPYVSDARSLAAHHGIGIAYSNPCFELWLVLHVRDQQAYIDRDQVQKLSDACGLTAGKAIVSSAWTILTGGYEAAKERAISGDKRHEENGSPLGSNPSTSVWRLVDAIRAGA